MHVLLLRTCIFASMYILFHKDNDGFGYAQAFQNRRVLADFLDGTASYSMLTYHFVRKRKVWIGLEGYVIIRIRTDIMKGSQGMLGFKNLPKSHTNGGINKG
jgi:hypothetical protein